LISLRRVAVTGGLGFIGSHVVDAFLAADHEVLVIDSMVGAVIDGSEYETRPGVELVRAPVEDWLAAGGSFAGFDRVVHAGSLVGPAGILKYAGTIGARIAGSTAAVLDACVEADVPVCTFSSAEVYGRSGLLSEKDDIIVPCGYNARIEYAAAKTLTEVMTVNSRHRGLRGIVIRPFNVTGPRQSRAGGFVMPTFVEQAQAGRPLTVFAGGDQVRAFLSATDLTRFVVEFMDAAIDSEHHVFNVGNPGNAITIRGLAHRVNELLGTSSPVIDVNPQAIHGPLYQEAESFEKVPVLDAATSVGWQPKISLDELILETAEYYASHADVRAEGTNAPL
jgi:nucleoside-diphosphate-sugar epimerase